MNLSDKLCCNKSEVSWQKIPPYKICWPTWGFLSRSQTTKNAEKLRVPNLSGWHQSGAVWLIWHLVNWLTGTPEEDSRHLRRRSFFLFLPSREPSTRPRWATPSDRPRSSPPPHRSCLRILYQCNIQKVSPNISTKYKGLWLFVFLFYKLMCWLIWFAVKFSGMPCKKYGNG